MKYQRGLALSGLLFWSVIIVLSALLGLKILPTVIDYYKILKDAKATVAKVEADATVAQVRDAFDRFAGIDMLEFNSKELDISKDNGKIVIEFSYEKRIPLFANVSLLIDYKGSTRE